MLWHKELREACTTQTTVRLPHQAGGRAWNLPLTTHTPRHYPGTVAWVSSSLSSFLSPRFPSIVLESHKVSLCLLCFSPSFRVRNLCLFLWRRHWLWFIVYSSKWDEAFLKQWWCVNFTTVLSLLSPMEPLSQGQEGKMPSSPNWKEGESWGKEETWKKKTHIS